jgi:hypothetical protein
MGVLTLDGDKVKVTIDLTFCNKKARQRLIPSRSILVFAVLRGQREPLYNTLSNLSNVFLYFLTPKQTFFTNSSQFCPLRRAKLLLHIAQSSKSDW